MAVPSLMYTTPHQHCVFTTSRAMQFILSILPAHVRRAVILISLAAKVEQIKPEDAVILHSINKTMDLVDNENSLKMPIMVKDLIWVDTSDVSGELNALKNNVMPNNTLHEYARHLVKKIPKSLRYAGEDDMEGDIFQLFRHQHAPATL